MNIVVCGDCLWLGVDAELSILELESVKEIEPLAKIIKANGLVLNCCPKCGKSKIFRKPGRSFNFGTFATQNIPVNNLERQQAEIIDNDNARVREEIGIPSEEEDLDSALVEELLNSAEEPAGSFIEQVNSKLEKPKQTRKRDLGKSYKCNDCNKSFNSRFETNRCPECNEIMLKKYT